MDNANKILDVSYGGFSCRLEGFEDSVETMKTIVMYFHDLAGHDRFMDVEPQAPDMEELARLTEEQTGAPVEVEGEGQQVSLRAGAALAGAFAAADEDDVDLAEELATLEDEDWADEAEEVDGTQDSADHDDALDETDDTPVLAETDDAQDDWAEDQPHAEEAHEADDLAEDADDADDADDDGFDDALMEASVADRLQRIKDVVEQGATDEEPDLAEMVETAEDAFDADIAEVADAMDDDADAVSESEAFAAAAPSADDASAADDPHEEMAITETHVAAEEMAETVPTEAVAAEYAEDVPAYTDELEAASTEADDQEVAQDDATDDAAADAPGEAGPLVLTSQDAAMHGTTDSAPADDDDDFDLQAEVAKIEAELAQRKGNPMSDHGLPRSVDEAMSRILSQTDQHLNQPESRRHRDAFAQLKAAVAATEAARQLGDAGTAPVDPDEAYKDDLGAHDAEERDEAEAAAEAAPKAPPLKLVQSDIAEDATPASAPAPSPAVASAPRPVDAASARLREIASRKEAPVAPSSVSFKDFAADHGAVEIIDMIEAAAAYLFYIEGDADFSRPQVMKMVQTATGTEISREDGLRAFGRLLRLARIVKLESGRFRVSDTTEFRPDGAQAAQG